MNTVRQVTRHHIEPGRADMDIQITAQGPYGPGGDQSQYVVTAGAETLCHVQFQQGNPADYGVNGVSLEALLAICLDRLDHLQRGPYASPYNEHARLDIERAIESLNDRVRERDLAKDAPLYDEDRVAFAEARDRGFALGVSPAELHKELELFGERCADFIFTGGGWLRDAFVYLGVTAKDLERRSTDQCLGLCIRRLSEFPKYTDRVFAAENLIPNGHGWLIPPATHT